MEEERAKLAAAEEERTKTVKQAAEKKRKADTDKATALFETVSSLWDEQVTDDLWSDEASRAEEKEKMKQLIAAQPELSKDLFKIVHCASARYAEVLSGEHNLQNTTWRRAASCTRGPADGANEETVHFANALQRSVLLKLHSPLLHGGAPFFPVRNVHNFSKHRNENFEPSLPTLNLP